MVPWKSWVSKNFGPISESRKRFCRVSESRFHLVRLGLGISDCFRGGVGFFRSAHYVHTPHLIKSASENHAHYVYDALFRLVT